MKGQTTTTPAVSGPGTTGSGGFVLSPEQDKVINHRGDHLHVIACAGAGKTEAVARRVASLTPEGLEPAQIIAFTFTERAAESLKARITRRVAEAKGPTFLDRFGPLFVGTIHACCLRMLQDRVPEFGNYDTLDEVRLAGLLSREYKRLELSKLGNQHWRSLFDFLRNDMLIDGGREVPPRPVAFRCRACDMRAICKHAQCSKYDI